MIKKNIGCFSVILSMMTLFLSCSSDDTNDNAEIKTEREIPIKVMVAKSSTEELVRTYTGTLEGKKQAVIYSKIAEAVNNVHVREGNQVKADQVIVSLDNYGATSSYQQNLALYKNAEKNYNKMAYLYEEGAVSESAYDAAKTDYEVSKAAWEAADKLVNIQTPIAGTITSLLISKGDYLTAGQKIATIATIDTLRVKFGVNEKDIKHVDEGNNVNLVVNSLNLSAPGIISSVAKSADPFNRSYQVEALLINSDKIFSPGMFVRIEIIMDVLENVIKVPRQTVLNLDGKDLIYTVKNNKAKLNEVKLGEDIDGHVIISSGLTPGDTLVTLGQDYLEDDIKVKITSMESGE